MKLKEYVVLLIFAALLFAVGFHEHDYTAVEGVSSVTQAVSDTDSINLTAIVPEEEPQPPAPAGGGGGAAIVPPEEEAEEEEIAEEREFRFMVKFLRSIPEAYRSDITAAELKLKELTADVTLEIFVQEAEGKESKFEKLDADAVPLLYFETRYLTEDPGLATRENTLSAGLEFKVSREFMEQNNISADAVYLIRKADDGEEVYRANFTKTEGGYAHFSVFLPGFSEFLIYGEKHAAPPPVEKEKAPPASMIAAALAIILAMAIFPVLKGRRKKEKEAKIKV